MTQFHVCRTRRSHIYVAIFADKAVRLIARLVVPLVAFIAKNVDTVFVASVVVRLSLVPVVVVHAVEYRDEDVGGATSKDAGDQFPRIRRV